MDLKCAAARLYILHMQLMLSQCSDRRSGLYENELPTSPRMHGMSRLALA